MNCKIKEENIDPNIKYHLNSIKIKSETKEGKKDNIDKTSP